MKELNLTEIDFEIARETFIKGRKLRAQWHGPYHGYEYRDSFGEWLYRDNDIYPDNKKYPVFNKFSKKVWFVKNRENPCAEIVLDTSLGCILDPS